MVLFKFIPCRPLLPWQRIFGTKIDYNSAPVKDNYALFAPTPPSNTQQLGYYSVAMGLIPRSTERIFSLVNFQALENTAEGVSFGRGQRHSR